MIFYAIRDRKTGNMWSRNNWGNPKSTPDLYKREKDALWQITLGKAALVWTDPAMAHLNTCPEIVTLEVREVGVLHDYDPERSQWRL